MSTDLEIIDLTQIVGDFEQPCDFRVGWPDTPHSTIRWAAWRVPCPCGRPAYVACICDNCKDYLMLSDSSIQCAGCPEIYSPAREIISRIEAL